MVTLIAQHIFSSSHKGADHTQVHLKTGAIEQDGFFADQSGQRLLNSR
jgi:hypothetical protein